MEIRTARRPGRPNETTTSTTNEVMKDIKNDEQITGQGHRTTTKCRQEQHHDRNEFRINDEEQNPHQNSHPAWNPDSRWSR